MSTRNFCDGCGNELTGYRARLRGEILHSTSDGEYVGEDDIKQVDLCKGCLKRIQEIVSFKISGTSSLEGMSDEAATELRGMHVQHIRESP
jgi:predicted Fe-S protein YdhL (DUF1289 family)